jgi:hypothetical protein
MSTLELPPSDDALRDLREVSTFQADEGQLVGRDPREVPLETLALYHREKKSSQGPSSAMLRLLLWCGE